MSRGKPALFASFLKAFVKMLKNRQDLKDDLRYFVECDRILT